MNSNRIGPLLLSGLIVGPILGSGIIILPPIVYQTTGDYALLAWLLMMMISFLFALVFGKLYILFPGDSGAAEAVEETLGKPFRNLGAAFLITAVSLGPIAVLGTASEYLSLWTGTDNNPFYLLGLLLFCYTMVTMSITSLGRFSLILSSLIVIILVSGSVHSLLFAHGRMDFRTPFQPYSFGYSLLLLFWCLVGWEIIGSYSGEVRSPNKTIPRAIWLSCLVITMVSLTVAAALQWVEPERLGVPYSGKLEIILISLFGRYASMIISLVTILLCLSTVIMVIGAVSRLIRALAAEGVLPSIFSCRNRKQVPIAALLALFVIHFIIFLLVSFKLIPLIQLVAIADAFFLCNAFLGILAAFRLLKERWVRWTSAFLGFSLLFILIFTSQWVLVVIAGMSVYTGWRTYQSKQRKYRTAIKINKHKRFL
ncbi:amino acid permease [Sporolactobacillus sp. THM7-4]|nr:amino acid permease [Sporolactobacillus sp. THM7-4]